MPRIPLAVAPSLPHHLTQKDNYQEYILKDKDGFRSRMERMLGRQLKDLSSGGFVKRPIWALSPLKNQREDLK